MLNQMTVDFALWRVWAADIRDGNGKFAEDAGILCRLMDAHETIDKKCRAPDGASNLTEGLDASMEILVKRLLAAGYPAPKQRHVETVTDGRTAVKSR